VLQDSHDFEFVVVQKYKSTTLYIYNFSSSKHRVNFSSSKNQV